MLLFQQNERRRASIAGAASGREAAFTEAGRLEDVIARHLIRFGADGELQVTWVSSPEA